MNSLYLTDLLPENQSLVLKPLADKIARVEQIRDIGNELTEILRNHGEQGGEAWESSAESYTSALEELKGAFLNFRDNKPPKPIEKNSIIIKFFYAERESYLRIVASRSERAALALLENCPDSLDNLFKKDVSSLEDVYQQDEEKFGSVRNSDIACILIRIFKMYESTALHLVKERHFAELLMKSSSLIMRDRLSLIGTEFRDLVIKHKEAFTSLVMTEDTRRALLLNTLLLILTADKDIFLAFTQNTQCVTYIELALQSSQVNFEDYLLWIEESFTLSEMQDKPLLLAFKALLEDKSPKASSDILRPSP